MTVDRRLASRAEVSEMTRMTVGDLHDQTERAVAIAEAGVDVEVTRDGDVVARLAPVTASAL